MFCSLLRHSLEQTITLERESCDFEPPDEATLETLDKHWQKYKRKSNFSIMMDCQILHMLNNRAKEHFCIGFGFKKFNP